MGFTVRRATALGGVAALALAPLQPLSAQMTNAASTLIDQDGHPFRFTDLRPHRSAVSFIATSCTGVCPLIELLFMQLDRACLRSHVDARLVLVTLDPSFDTPFVMAERAAALHAVPPRFRLVSGPQAAVHAVMRTFGVTVVVGPDGIPEEHSTEIYVLDRYGRIVRVFPISNEIGGILTTLRD